MAREDALRARRTQLNRSSYATDPSTDNPHAVAATAVGAPNITIMLQEKTIVVPPSSSGRIGLVSARS
ncbi:hypothetical protein A6X20_01560 [Bradyrhizobium elkanii]|nr:hypothetical protein A6452_16850 [Bradyrhizobium elkanii]ODM86348.1 hypothetical protein A6X20_01560 [Bradyrhizobium elkanii]